MAHITGGNILLDASTILNKAQAGEGMRIADLGCGRTGHFVFPAARLVGKNGRVYAVDILKTALENIERRARQDNIRNIFAIWSDLEVFGAAKIESGSIDIALLINTLHQSHKRAEILRETIRMTKKGGKLIIVEWKNIALPFGPPPEERVKKESLMDGAQRLGLRLEEEFFVGHLHYGLLFIKL